MVSLRDGLVGEWLFDGNSKDTSGSGNDGTVTNATLTTDNFGRTNRAYNFDGTGDYIDMGNILDITTSTITISALVYKTNDTPTNSIISKNWQKFQIRSLANTNNVRFTLNTEDNLYDLDGTNGDFPNNTWIHIVGLYDGSNMYLYGNGVLLNSRAQTGAIKSYTQNLYISSLEGSSQIFNGKIKNVQIWDRMLSDEEIQQLYHDIKPSYQSLFEGVVGYWDLNKDAKDVLSANDGSTSASLTTGRFNEDDGAHLFNGTSDDITITSYADIVFGTANYCVSMWVYLDSTFSSSFPAMIGKGDTGTGEWMIRYISGDTNVYGAGGDLNINFGTLPTNQWVNIIVNRTGSNTTYGWVDGVRGSLDVTDYDLSTTVDLTIGGADNNSSRWWKGKIQEVIFWNRGLTDDEVAEYYDLSKNKKLYPFIRGVKD